MFILCYSTNVHKVKTRHRRPSLKRVDINERIELDTVLEEGIGFLLFMLFSISYMIF